MAQTSTLATDLSAMAAVLENHAGALPDRISICDWHTLHECACFRGFGGRQWLTTIRDAAGLSHTVSGDVLHVFGFYGTDAEKWQGKLEALIASRHYCRNEQGDYHPVEVERATFKGAVLEALAAYNQPSSSPATQH
jgi:hypothetical protein